MLTCMVYRTCLLDVKQLSCILSAYMLHYDNIYSANTIHFFIQGGGGEGRGDGLGCGVVCKD